MVYIIAKLGCLISCVTVREWFISISEILPQEEDGSEKKSSMSYDIDEDLKSHGSSTFDAISSSTTATSLVDSTVEANINRSRECQDEQWSQCDHVSLILAARMKIFMPLIVSCII